MTSRPAIAAGAAVIVAAVAVFALSGKDGSQPAPSQQPAPQPSADAPRVVDSPAAAPQPSAAPLTEMKALPKVPDNKHAVTYPGGVKMPGLNGITEDVKMNWGVGPFTPVVGIVTTANGWQWYVHENGAQSTVAMVAVNGTPQAMGIVAEPTPAVAQPPLQQGKQPAK